MKSSADIAQWILMQIICMACIVLVSATQAANLSNAQFTPLKEPECVLNTSNRFIAHDAAAQSYPTTPKDRYYLVVRHMGTKAVSTPVTTDFGSLGTTPITNFHPPNPYGNWQRAKANADANTVSGFQIHCTDVGSFINTWTFPIETIVGGGAHTFYSYDFTNPPSTFDNNPATDLVLQVSMEIPWIRLWGNAVGQVSMATYLVDTTTNQHIALIINIFDNRYATYDPSIIHDGDVPFLSSPLRTNTYVTVSPYSARSTNTPWSGLRFFRAHIMRTNFIQTIGAINNFCAKNRQKPNCGANYSSDLTRYKMLSFGILHEVFRNPSTHISMGVHLQRLGAYLAR